MKRARPEAAILFLALSSAGCSADNDAVLDDATRDARAAADAKQALVTHAADLHAAAAAIQTAAPASPWNAAAAPDALAAMRTAWKQARQAYQGLAGMADSTFP